MRNLDSKVKKEIKKTQEEINDLYMQAIQRKFIFTKQKYYEVGGKSIKLLAYRLRKQQADNSIYTRSVILLPKKLKMALMKFVKKIKYSTRIYTSRGK